LGVGEIMTKKKLSTWDKVKAPVYGTASTLGSMYGWDILMNMIGGKDGGRVTKRGIGRAKRGFGRVMGRKK